MICLILICFLAYSRPRFTRVSSYSTVPRSESALDCSESALGNGRSRQKVLQYALMALCKEESEDNVTNCIKSRSWNRIVGRRVARWCFEQCQARIPMPQPSSHKEVDAEQGRGIMVQLVSLTRDCGVFWLYECACLNLMVRLL